MATKQQSQNKSFEASVEYVLKCIDEAEEFATKNKCKRLKVKV